MWIAEIAKVIKEKGQIILVVDYSESATNEVITRDYRISGSGNIEDQYKTLIRNELASFNAAYTFADQIQVGTPDLTEAPPEPEDVARTKFVSDLRVLRKMESAIQSGVKKNTDQDYLDQLALVKIEFIPAYMDLF